VDCRRVVAHYMDIEMKVQRKNALGLRIGMLRVIAPEKGNEKGAKWLCRCDCGKDVVRCWRHISYSLKRGSRSSCGCKPRHSTHLASDTPEYTSYSSAKNRCNNSNDKNFEHYGGRGISFLYSSFEEFLQDVGKRPSLSHSLDRIDNNGNYAPGNCRWSTQKEQCNNRRNKRIENFSTQELLAELTRRGLPYFIVR